MQINIVGALSSSMSKFPAIQKINLAYGTPYSSLLIGNLFLSKRYLPIVETFSKCLENVIVTDGYLALVRGFSKLQEIVLQIQFI